MLAVFFHMLRECTIIGSKWVLCKQLEAGNVVQQHDRR